ncbi:hypothetical protein BYZ73_19265 [Rhodovulum viride]|uniref:Uncharacterized protein n=2 Tax=Rhodovulum viride TaxID=1231134 RepID=A0ABX9DBG3_9RHOB|nr:hypothetical protein BYZ73_19265 [Rhodovulum viride]
MWDISYMLGGMMMSAFRNEIEAFLAESGMKPSTLGREVLNDPGFVARIRKGGECRPSTIDKVRREIEVLRRATPTEDAA